MEKNDMQNKDRNKKTSTGEQQNKFHEWIRNEFTWVDNDLKKYTQRAWFACIKANKN